MMRSWADHCSSDEDTDDNYSVESEADVQEEQPPLEETFDEKVTIEEPEPVARTYDFPSRPPFTAFVGNLSYDIQEASQLQQALADVVFDRLGERVHVLGGRISYDRNGGKRHRGFGYVELETLDELKTVMKLNDDDQAMLAGRKVQLDTANHQNNRQNNNNRRGNNNNNDRGSFRQNTNEKIDGSKFRGGKFNNQNNNFRNKSKDDAPRQRPTFKLAPRSKPIDSDRSASSDIFGGAKARDEQAWEKNRQQQAEEKKKILLKKNPDDSKKDIKSEQEKRQNGRGRGGKGGRGNRGGGRGDQNKKGSGRRNSQTDKKQDKKQAEEKPAAKPNTEPADSAPESKPDKAAPKNKFALLMDDSDSD